MEEQYKHIDDLFRERLSGYQETAEREAWDLLEPKLLAHKYRRLIPAWRWYIPALLFIALGSVMLMWDKTGKAIGNRQNEATDTYTSGIMAPAKPAQKAAPMVPANHIRIHSVVPNAIQSTSKLTINTHTAFTGQDILLTNATGPVQNAQASIIDGGGLMRSAEAMPVALPGREDARLIGVNMSLALSAWSMDIAAAHVTAAIRELEPLLALGHLPLQVDDTRLAQVEKPSPAPLQAPEPVKAAEREPAVLEPAAAYAVATQGADKLPAPLLQASLPGIDVVTSQVVTSIPEVASIPERTSIPEVAENKEKKEDNSVVMPKRTRNRLTAEGGIRAGISSGVSSPQKAGVYVGPYLQANLSKHISLAFRPAIRYNSVMVANPDSRSFYSVKGSQVDSTTWQQPVGVPKYMNYFLAQDYDSIIITYRISKSMLEFELPLLFQYSIGKHFRVEAGPVLSLGRNVQVEESKTVYSLVLQDSTSFQSKSSSSNALTGQFEHTVPQYSNVPMYPNESGTQMRWGYMLGMSYQLKQRINIDLMVHQNLNGYDKISNSDVQKVYTQPTVRIGFGYRLF